MTPKHKHDASTRLCRALTWVTMLAMTLTFIADRMTS